LDARPIPLSYRLAGRHLNLVKRISFIDNGTLLSDDAQPLSVKWDLASRAPIDAVEGIRISHLLQRRVSPDGKWFASPNNSDVYVYPLPDVADYADRRRMTAPDPDWHMQQARVYEAQQRDFAKRFHLKAAEQARRAMSQE
jgi:hypothetical protein